jgi:hypothetical protein
MAESTPCPVCTTPLETRSDYGEKVYFKCPRCGTFGLTAHAEIAALPNLLSTPRKRSVLGYAISLKTRPSLPGTSTIVFDAEECERIVKADYLPTPQEQGENLIRWLGDHLPDPGRRLRIDFPETGARIGAHSKEGFLFIVQGLLSSGLLLGDLTLGGTADVTLTFPGWGRYEELRRGTPSGRKAFIAMEYGHTDLDLLVEEHFKPAVAETGFVLRRLDDEQPAGLIDDRLRVAIQSSRFVLVDLTHSNLGAYWEAGYAEGLGKPVIYTCEESAFAGKASHFDTNHNLHVLWNATNIDPALKKLKATIRATIPEATREL